MYSCSFPSFFRGSNFYSYKVTFSLHDKLEVTFITYKVLILCKMFLANDDIVDDDSGLYSEFKSCTISSRAI